MVRTDHEEDPSAVGAAPCHPGRSREPIPSEAEESAVPRTFPEMPTPQIYQADWVREQKKKTSSPQPDPALAPDTDHGEEELGVSQTEPAPGSAADAPPNPRPEPVAHPPCPSEAPSARYVSFVPDAFASHTRDPFSIPKGLFPRRR